MQHMNNNKHLSIVLRNLGLLLTGFAVAVFLQVFVIHAHEHGLTPLTFFISLIAALVLLTLPRIFHSAARKREKVVNIFMTVILLLLVLNEIFNRDGLFFARDFYMDDLVTALWLICGLLLLLRIGHDDWRRPDVAFVLVGIVLLALLLTYSLLASFTGFQDPPVVEQLELVAKALALLSYVGGVLVFVTSNWELAQRSPLVRFGQFLAQFLFNFEYSRIGAILAIALNNTTFFFWRLLHPGKQFKDFYAWQITRKLRVGRAHRTLGRRRFDQDNFFAPADDHDETTRFYSGAKVYMQVLRELGLHKGHVLVDYGCGSLRLGGRLIQMLGKGHYWGLDVTDTFYTEGLALMPQQIVCDKKPNLRVISPRSLAEVRRAKPDFIISIAVLKHVPPSELDQYFDNICGLAHEGTRLLISFTEADVEMRISGKSWAYAREHVASMLRRRLPKHDVRVLLDTPDKKRMGLELRKCLMAALPPAQD